MGELSPDEIGLVAVIRERIQILTASRSIEGCSDYIFLLKNISHLGDIMAKLFSHGGKPSDRANLDLLGAITQVFHLELSCAWVKLKNYEQAISVVSSRLDDHELLLLRAFASIADGEIFAGLVEELILIDRASAEKALIASLQLSLCRASVLAGDSQNALTMAQKLRQGCANYVTDLRSTGELNSGANMNMPSAEFMLGALDQQRKISSLVQSKVFPSRFVFILGMHRSGTSALAGLLEQLGLDGPSDPMAPSPDNPKGYVESLGIASLNDAFLARLGLTWRCESGLPENWKYSEMAIEWGQSLLDKIHELHAGSAHPVIKDPRLCLLVDGLDPFLNAGALTCHCILLVRNPAEVVESLLARSVEPISRAEALDLWIRSVLSSEASTRGLPRIFILASELFSDPDKCVHQILRFIGREDLVTSGIGVTGNFVDTSLRHHFRDHFPEADGGERDADICSKEVFAQLIYSRIANNLVFDPMETLEGVGG